MKILSPILFLILPFYSFCQGIIFNQMSYKDALALAEKENKYIFMDAYTVWCGPCKILSKEVFPVKEVGDLYNAKFINLKIDMEKGEGIKLMNKFQINSFPTLLYINSKGEILHRYIGTLSPPELISMGDAVLNPDKLKSIQAESTINYLIEYKTDTLKLAQLKKDFPAVYKKVFDLYKINSQYNAFEKDKTLENWQFYINSLKEYFGSENEKNINDLNNHAWHVYANYKLFNDKESLNLAEKMSAKSLEINQENDYCLDTYAHIIFDLGDKAKGIEYQKKALEIIKKENRLEMVDYYIKEIQKMEGEIPN